MASSSRVGRAFWDAELVMTEPASRIHDEKAIVAPYENCPVDVTVFISCYNEQEYIVGTLDTVRAALSEVGNITYEILVIDDVSKDNSVSLVKQYIQDHPNENILLRINKHNKGLAQNYFDAAFVGRGKYFRLICGDNAEPRETIVTVFKSLGEADILVPYYFSSEGKGFKRQLISKTFTGIINTITGYHFHYYNGLAVHLRTNIMRWHPNTRGFGFQADILTMLVDMGFTYKEIPVIMVEQRRGKSNAITFKNMLSVAHTIIDILIRRVSNKVYKIR
jgi:glycosyltransferase involved in cell wall biosynthesis